MNKEFEESYYCSGEISQSFAEKFNKLVDLKAIETTEFVYSVLSDKTFRRWKKE